MASRLVQPWRLSHRPRPRFWLSYRMVLGLGSSPMATTEYSLLPSVYATASWLWILGSFHRFVPITLKEDSGAWIFARVVVVRVDPLHGHLHNTGQAIHAIPGESETDHTLLRTDSSVPSLNIDTIRTPYMGNSDMQCFTDLSPRLRCSGMGQSGLHQAHTT